MMLLINGKTVTADNGSTITELLVGRNIEPAHVVVEVNGVIVPKEAFGAKRIYADDVIEILRFVGGG
jgi:sulfur carrier protein